MQLYIRVGFSLPTQGSLFSIHAGDSAGVGYHLRVMPRPWVKIAEGPTRLIKGVGPGALVLRGT